MTVNTIQEIQLIKIRKMKSCHNFIENNSLKNKLTASQQQRYDTEDNCAFQLAKKALPYIETISEFILG